MKRILSVLLLTAGLALLPAISNADVIASRDTVFGTVIGKNKEPLPGAKVEIVGQPYSAFTDIDGRFNIKCDRGAKKILVTYPKMRDVKKKISPDMTVRIGRSWRQVPERYQWFAGANIGVGVTSSDFSVNTGYVDEWGYSDYKWVGDDHIAPSLSVMIGRVKAVGWYLKGFYNCPAKGTYYGDDKASAVGGILGGMVRLGCPLHLYLGGGIARVHLSEYDKSLYKPICWQIDMGLLFRIKDNYGINLSMNLGDSSDISVSTGAVASLGFAYFFNK